MVSQLRETPRFEIVEAELRDAARAISECEVFFGNDAGLAHVAPGLGAKTVAVFGMTEPIRAIPYGKTLVARSPECNPGHDEGMRDFRCVLNIDYRCLKTLSPYDVQSRIERAFAGDVPLIRPEPSGPFQLYGKRRTVTS